MAIIEHTVVYGDCLWNISKKYLGAGNRWKEIANLNGISTSKPVIHTGDVLKIDTDGSGSSSTSTNNTSTLTIDYFGLQAGTDTTLFATWSWSKTNTDYYKVKWYYDTGNNDIWFIGSDSQVTCEENGEEDRQSTYSAPSNAKRVKLIIKPVAKTRTVNKKETAYWTSSWSTAKIYDFKDAPPSVPPVPDVEIVDYRLTAKLENIGNLNATSIHFKVVQDDKTVYKISDTSIRTETNSAQYACIVTAGSSYKVACRAARGTEYSEWSEFSGPVKTIPSAPAKITTCKAKSETSVYLEWEAVNTADTYDIEYTTKREYFDGSNSTTTVNGIEFTHYEITGMETGSEYFFRIRAVNEEGESGWSSISSVTIGDEPAAPTTWSSTTTAITGESLNLYWVHNASDGSSQTYAELEQIIDGVKEVRTIKNTEDEDEKDRTSVYAIDTSKYTEGSKIQWRVRTAGVTKAYGDWSIQREVDIYAPPTLALDMTDKDGNSLRELTSFPFYISALAGPNTQVPIGYHLTITANETYETVDDIGNSKIVARGEAVYSKYIDTTSELVVEFSANNVDLENNVQYTVTCVVTMNSGLTVESSLNFAVAWTGAEYEPNAEIGIDYETLIAYIRPYCDDENGDLIPNLYMSVYRREFDGSFTEIIKNVDNSHSLFVTDPHPSLDYARYRIVATDKTTGAVSYYDVPGYPVGETGIIIQWDEDWTTFDTTNEDAMVEPAWSGSLLKLPYNVDVSDNHNADVSKVAYIGRKRPVTYYGTQLGESATWNVVIPKSDKETLYALRRLAIWMGDVYVREPSGSGYWANISVSFSQKHLDLTIPITLSITRVEGGA